MFQYIKDMVGLGAVIEMMTLGQNETTRTDPQGTNRSSVWKCAKRHGLRVPKLNVEVYTKAVTRDPC